MRLTQREKLTGKGLLGNLLFAFGLIDEEELKPGILVSTGLAGKPGSICEHVVEFVVVSLICHLRQNESVRYGEGQRSTGEQRV